MKVLAIDIGGSFIKYGIFDDKKLIHSDKLSSEADKGTDFLVKNVDKIVENMISNYDIEGIAMSTAGIVDPIKGEIIHSGPTIPNYKGFNWKMHIKDKFNLIVELDNDVNCAALGEYTFGSARGKDCVLMLAIGTGIGGAFIKNGEIYRGANGCGLEVGYMNIDGGNFEKLASTLGLINNFNNISDKKVKSGFEIFELAKNKDSKAISAIDSTMDYLCRGIANITYVLDPKYIVLGGGIMEQEEILRPIIEKYLEKYMLPLASKNVELLFAEAGNMAASYGALYHFYNKIN